MTKRETNTRMAELVHQYQMVGERAEDMRKAQDAGKRFTNEEWQDIYKKFDEIDAKIENLDREWARRNWTASDYAMSEMVAENKD